MSKPVCSARVRGPNADTMIVLNGRTPILSLGRPDWTGLYGSVEFKAAIDGHSRRAVKGQMFENQILILPSDPELLAGLRDAKSVEWILPFGHFRADVQGFGAAYDAVVVCGAQLSTP